MRRGLGLALAAVLAVGVVIAIVVSVAQRITPAAPLTVVHGVIGSEKQPFFQDPAVIQVFHDHGLDVRVDTAGSRQIATTVNLSKYDFAFPAGAPAAEKIRTDHHITSTYSPFYTPMAVATFDPIAQLLTSAGVVKQSGSYSTIDMQAYLALVSKNARWSDLPNNTAYPATKSILITSTDIRKSNSAAMYLALASYVANGDNIVQDTGQASAVLPKVAPLFLRQGFSASSTEEPFQDYLSIGIGKTPMVMIYEAQFLDRQAAKDPALTKEMMLLYPNPDILSKHTFVPLNHRGDQAGQLLLNDSRMQALAAKYGFRTNNPAVFNSFASSHGLKPPSLVNIIEPPTYEVLEAMITAIELQIQGA